MSNVKYFALGGKNKAPIEMPTDPAGARAEAVWMDGSAIPGCIFGEACWYTKPFEGTAGMIKHNSDEVLLFIGGDHENPEDLGATVELWIENDKLTLTNTCAVFVPEGAAHGKLVVKDMKKPLFHYSCHLNTDTYETIPAEATAPEGTYKNSYVERYCPPDGKLPGAPEGFLKLLLYLDGVRLKGAPYLEAVWFCTTNDTGPAPHAHEDFDEFIGFMGTDPENPEELGATVEFMVEDEKVTVTKSCLVYIPRGLTHSPIYVPQMDRPIIHFSGGNGGDYVRSAGDGTDLGRENNSYKA